MYSFEKRNLSPMLFEEAKDVFNSPDYLYELKFDGIRCLAYLDEATELINKRGKILNQTYPELKNLHQNVKVKMLLDGELLLIKNGKPDFYALQRRSLMTDPFKIKIQTNINPVIYVAFDLLYLKDKFLIDTPLLERKKLLQENVQESKDLIISKYIKENGQKLFQVVKEMKLEGIVAKKKDSHYYPGKRSSVWLKIKIYEEDDLIICGYIPKENVIDLILGRYLDGKIIRAGSVVTGKFKQQIINYAKNNPSIPLFPKKENVIWMVPKLVGRVRYMMKTKEGGLRQPVFMGVRDDKFAEDLLN
ncbi:MAG: DNA ligase [Bacilli bacterium]|jgi:bifunctional non-homologous end joining protein LigD